MYKLIVLIAAAAILGGCAAAYRSGDAPPTRSVVKMGLEAGRHAAGRSGSFTNDPGFTADYVLGIPLEQGTGDRYMLGIDLNYSNTIGYRLHVVKEFLEGGVVTERVDTDERYSLSSFQCGLLPEYLHPLGGSAALGVYAGGSIGVGSEVREVNTLSYWMPDSIKNRAIDILPVAPYTIDAHRPVFEAVAGASLYYKKVMIGLQYRYTHMSALKSPLYNFSDLYIQAGFVF